MEQECERILTLWEPWASAVRLGYKSVETRSWSTAYRGPLWIHAARAAPDPDHLEEVNDALFAAGFGPLPWTLPSGKVVARAILIECVPTRPESPTSFFPETAYRSRWAEGTLEHALGNYEPGRWAWVLDDVRGLVEPVGYRGGQGLRTLAAEDLGRLRAAEQLPTTELRVRLGGVR